jgi:multiple sugar transport system substrate-binding protein
MRNKTIAFPFALSLLAMATSALAAPTEITMWRHESGDVEVEVVRSMIDGFNKSQNKYKVVYENLPKGSYTQSVTAGAVAKKLPCLIDMDQPTVANFAWSGHIRPIGDLVDKNVVSQMLNGGKGEYKGILYSVGQFDAALGIFARKSALDKAGLRTPTIDKPWTLAEFNDALAKLKTLPDYEYVIDMHNTFDGEWWTYAFSPWMQSFGGDLIDRKDFKTAKGVINGADAIKAMTTLQGWVKAGYVNAASKDDSDFVKGKAALSYVGHWTFGDYKKALGDDLVLIPMPNFGKKAVTGAGSWNFGISADCKAPSAAAKVLAYFMSPAEVGRVTGVNGAIPATFTAMNANKNFAKGGALEIYAQQAADKVSLVRPETPAYPTITTAFAEAVNNIVAGADVKSELDKAAKKIDQNIEDNKGYPVK